MTETSSTPTAPHLTADDAKHWADTAVAAILGATPSTGDGRVVVRYNVPTGYVFGNPQRIAIDQAAALLINHAAWLAIWFGEGHPATIATRQRAEAVKAGGGAAGPATTPADMRYPSNRPSWLGTDQPWPCGRCGREEDNAEPHECNPPTPATAVYTTDSGAEVHFEVGE